MKTHDKHDRNEILSSGVAPLPTKRNDIAKFENGENNAALRLSRVVDVSALMGRTHDKANATKKAPKQNNLQNKQNRSENSASKQEHASPNTGNRHSNTVPSQAPNAKSNDVRTATARRLTNATQKQPTRDASAKNKPHNASSPHGASSPQTLISEASTAPQNAVPQKRTAAPTGNAATTNESASKNPHAPTRNLHKHAVHVTCKATHKRDKNTLRTPRNKKHLHKLPLAPNVVKPTSSTHTENNRIEQALMLQSWHARLWCDAVVNMSPAVIDSLPNAIPIVSAGLVNNICITPGCIEATIFDQVVSISLRQFAIGQWKNVISMLSDRAIFATSLLNGELPEGIIDIFKQASLSLFPTKIREFSFHCDCKSTAVPCVHACALLIAFAQRLEEDPFNILTLRGITRETLLSMLRDARSDQVVDEKTRYRITYELPAQSVSFADYYSPRDGVDSLNFHISYTPATLLKRLHDPLPWDAPISVESILQPIIDAAAREAESLGQCEHYEIQDSPQISKKNAKHGKHAANNAIASRAPRNANKDPIPDMAFIPTAIPPEILAEMTDDPIHAARDIYRWLQSRGASDIRTLARRTRLHKTTIEAFLNAFLQKGIVICEGNGDKIKFNLAPPQAS